MAWQLIYTSAPRTLSAGQSGYGTVARSLDLREALIHRLEQLSYYRHPSGASGPAGAGQPAICAYRIMDLRGAKYHLLTRIQDAGLDFTNRTNHLAHHLVFAPEELAALPSPAILFQQWDGWRSEWRQEPRFLDESDWGNFSRVPRAVPLPAETWRRLTGDAGRAAALIERPCANGCHLLCDPGNELHLLGLFAESLQLLDPENKSPAKCWQFPFTTLLQEQDNPADFRWRGCGSGSPLAGQRGASAILSPPGELPVPDGALANLARHGLSRPVTAPSAGRAAEETRGGGTSARLKPTQSPEPRHIRGWEPEQIRETAARPAKPARKAALNFLSPRFFGPAAGVLVLLLLLLGAFQWPGWLVSHKEAPRYSSNTTSAAVAPKAESPAANQVVLLGDDLSPKPLSSAQQPRLERKSLPSQAVAQLSSQLDAVHSYFLMAGSRDIVELTGVPELERLLGKIMASIAPVSADAIECEALANSLQLASPKSGSALHLKVDTFARYLLAASDVEEFRIDFKNWYLDHSKPILMQLPGASRASLALHFRPKAGSAAFESFRIVIIGEGGPPAPIQLSTAFLSVNQTNFADTVDFSLREKLELLVRPPSSQLQLRPFLGSKPLYDELGLNQPREGYELNLDAARDQMLRRMEIAEAGAEKLAATVLQLENSIAQANAADIQLGILLGHKPEDALASFAAFARSHNSKMNRLTFLGYLKAVLKKKLADQELDKLDRVESPPRILKDLPSLLAKAGFEEQLKGIGKDYFVARWKSLGLANQLTKMQAEKEKADFELLSWKLRSALVPPDLSGLSRVSLFLITNGSRPLELIRFTAP